MSEYGWRWLAGAVVAAALIVGAAIWLDDLQLSTQELGVAEFVATILGGLALLGGGFRYLWERQREFAWEKTKFIVDLFGEFEREGNLRRAQLLIDEATATQDDSYLEKILASGGSTGLSEEERNDRNAIDRYLDFFDHLYTYVFITKTLSIGEVASFSGYAIDIMDTRAVADFALRWGYNDVLSLAVKFDDNAETSPSAEYTKRVTEAVAAHRQNPVT